MTKETNANVKANPLNYGQCQALKVLVAEKMGMCPSNVADAQKMMRGETLHPMISASVDREAARIHNELASDGAKVAKANQIGQSVLAEHVLA